MTIEAKHQNAYECRPTAKLLWGMNELPWLQSVSDGIFRRVKIVKMEALSVLDPGVKDRIEREGAGILRWASESMPRQTRKGRPLKSITQRARTSSMGTCASPVNGFRGSKPAPYRRMPRLSPKA